jgi:myo-inositol-1(or 4)-monophosphatase
VASNPLYAATAVEAVVRAGDMMLARVGRDIRIDKKSAIDLVTEVDVAIERMFRELIATRFPDHAVLGEEFGRSASVPRDHAGSLIRSTATNFAWLPIFCSSLALEFDGVAEIAAVRPLAS